MELSSLTLFVTNACNFDCVYCYQKKGRNTIEHRTLERALDFFLPFLTRYPHINFYGGEPLLAFDRIVQAVHYCESQANRSRRRFRYSITTNGSLVDDEVLGFLRRHEFSLLLSFDGLAQERFRKKGSFNQIVSLIERLLERPGLYWETNTVFTPESVGCLSESIRFIANMGVPNVGLSPDMISEWNPDSLLRLEEECKSLRGYLIPYYQKSRQLPLMNFRRTGQEGIFRCYAGRDRMAVSPEGKLWGCHLFLDAFNPRETAEEHRRYSFGDLETFIRKHESLYPEVLRNYAGLGMDHFHAPDRPCFLCDDVHRCGVCPVNNFFARSDVSAVPRWVCTINKIFRTEKKLFWETLGERG